MQWLKTWLMKWLGVDEVRTENAELIQRLEILTGEFVKIGVRVENLREHYASVKEMGDACMARLDRETMKLATAINDDRTARSEYAHRIDTCLTRINADLIDVVKAGERDNQRISELEALVKDATLDTALLALEDRVSKIEATPVPAPGPQGRRGGSAWNSHQVAASAGAALANGVPLPIPTPGVS